MTVPPVILQILPALGMGGVERGTIDIARAIIAAGGKALVASNDGIWRRNLEKIGAQHICLPLHSKNPFVMLQNKSKLQKIIRKHQVDIVHARSRAPAWSAWGATKACNVPFVTTWHGVFQENWAGKRRYNEVMAKGSRVIAISQFVAQRIQEKYGVDKERLRIIYRGVDTKIFNPDLPLGDRMVSLLKKWQLPEEKKIIMLPGRLTQWKGHELLLHALAQLGEEYKKNWICVFLGPAKSKDNFVDSLITLSKHLKLNSNLFFAGECQDMPAALALADIVVVPSLKPEPFGRVITEAQAMQRIVVVANHGGAAETVRDGETGFTFIPNHVKSLTDTINKVMQTSQEDLEWIGRLAREDVEAYYTLEKMQSNTLSVYNEILPTTKQLRI